MRPWKLLIILTFVSSCSLTRSTLILPPLKLQLNEASELEQQLSSNDITPDHLISIGTSIYPNPNDFELLTPKTFELKEDKWLKLETQYFYDSTEQVRVILYQWSYRRDKSFMTKKEKAKKIEIFQQKFDQLTEIMQEHLGQSTESELGSANGTDSFRDGAKWINGNRNAYLFLLGNNRTAFRRLRLTIYSE